MLIFGLFLGCLTSLNCEKKEKESKVYYFPVNDFSEVIAEYNLQLDSLISRDGVKSFRIDSEDTTTAYLFAVRNIPYEKCKFLWSAQCKTEELDGKVFLEVGVLIPEKSGKGKTYFSRSKETIGGTRDWSKMQVEFLSTEPVKPELTQLNMIVEGSGRVWVDKIKLTVIPL